MSKYGREWGAHGMVMDDLLREYRWQTEQVKTRHGLCGINFCPFQKKAMGVLTLPLMRKTVTTS